MQGGVYEAIKRAVDRGDYDELLALATAYHTPEGQRIFREAIERAAKENRQELDNINEFLANHKQNIKDGAFDGYS